MDVLLRESAADRTMGWRALLESEPGLVLWAILSNRAWREGPPSSKDDVADWLRDEGPHAFAADRLGTPPADAPAAEILDRLADCALRSLQVASLAAEAAAKAGAAAEAVWLLGLLHNAAEWLELATDQAWEPSCDAGHRSVPDWLVAWQDRVRSQENGSEGPTSDATAGWVADACRSIAATASASEWSAAGDDTAAKLADGDAIRRRWRMDVLIPRDLLRQVCRRLSRLEQLETEFQTVLEKEKLESLKTLAYGASHEINNPLANISTRAQTLLRDERDPERRQKLAVINSQAFRAHEMIADMMLFARPPQLQRTSVDLTRMIDTVLAELRSEASEQSTRLQRVSADRPVLVQADENYLAVALKAICTNALEAVQGGGRIDVSCGPVESKPTGEHRPDEVSICVQDTGPGISAEARRHLFDPYFSGREAGRGLGLGLSKAWRLVTDHGGRIEVDSLEGQGSTFTIYLTHEACPETPTAP
jgi:signal transduction histidine kinase